MRRRMKDESGAVAVVVALSIVVLVGMAALAVDAGYLYSVRRQLQTAADAAALAGCRVMIEDGSEGEILAEARVYAEDENAVRPADSAVMVMDPPDTVVDFDEQSVQVTVTKESPLFFARIFGASNTPVVAKAKAKVAYLTGIRGIVPWSVPIIRANRVAVRVSGGAEAFLTDQGGGIWSGTVAVPMSASKSGKIVDIVAYNGQTAYPDGTSNGSPNGIPEPLPGASTVVVRNPSDELIDVSLSQYVATAGVDSTVRLTVEASEKPTARFNGHNYNLTNVTGNIWDVDLPVPAEDDLYSSFPIDVTVDKSTFDNAAVLIVRRSTFPVRDVSVSRHVLTTGDVGSVTVTVKMNEFTYGQDYELKVIGGAAEIGNFCAVDLSALKHTPNWRNPQDPSEYDLTTDPNYSTPAYYHYLAHEFPFSVHIGDTVWTQTGALSGPQTASALNERFEGNTMTFQTWEALGRPGSSRVVYVPIVEKVQDVTGQTPLRIVTFGAFYIDPGSDVNHNAVIGRFIGEAAPSDSLSDTPTGELYIETVHLVTPS